MLHSSCFLELDLLQIFGYLFYFWMIGCLGFTSKGCLMKIDIKKLSSITWLSFAFKKKMLYARQ